MTARNATARSVKSRKRRPKAKKPASPRRQRVIRPKPIEVEGHLLSPEIHRGFEAALVTRHQQGNSLDTAKRMALADVLDRHRPSTWAKGELLRVYKIASRIVLSIACMSDYNWHGGGVGTKAGCDCVGRLGLELARLSVAVSDIRVALLRESEEKLQHWHARQKGLEAIEHAGTQP